VLGVRDRRVTVLLIPCRHLVLCRRASPRRRRARVPWTPTGLSYMCGQSDTVTVTVTVMRCGTVYAMCTVLCHVSSVLYSTELL